MSRGSTSVFALVDCNNFFVSCERAFRPDLWHTPVAVLSNNDGCIVARSNEVKDLGVPMGIPYFKYSDTLNRHGVKLFSGNFALYGNFSQRVVQILQQACSRIEVYSVDESFLEISDLPIKDYEAWARDLRARILQDIGIPVSIGIASSKTLAKAAADFAKKNNAQKGAFSVNNSAEKCLKLLKWLPVEDVWGVGRRTAPKLREQGYRTAYDLTTMADAKALKQLTIRGLKMVKELQGESCSDLDLNDEPQKSIVRSRSFGHTVRNYYELEGAVATFAAQAAAKLRSKNEVAGAVMTYLYGSRHAAERRGGSFVVKLMPASQDTGDIIGASLKALTEVYDSDAGYKKAGIVLADLRPASAHQLVIYSDPNKLDRQASLMNTIDQLNNRLGTRLVRYASEHLENTNWHSRSKLRSPAYTTNWQQLPKIKAAA